MNEEIHRKLIKLAEEYRKRAAVLQETFYDAPPTPARNYSLGTADGYRRSVELLERLIAELLRDS